MSRRYCIFGGKEIDLERAEILQSGTYMSVKYADGSSEDWAWDSGSIRCTITIMQIILENQREWEETRESD